MHSFNFCVDLGNNYLSTSVCYSLRIPLFVAYLNKVRLPRRIGTMFGFIRYSCAISGTNYLSTLVCYYYYVYSSVRIITLHVAYLLVRFLRRIGTMFVVLRYSCVIIG